MRGFLRLDAMKLTLYRFRSDDEGTLGLLMAGGLHVCVIGELPWRDNRPNRSCIPLGAYRCEYLARSGSGKYRDVYHVTGVDSRSGVLIHKGNLSGDVERGYRSDVLGCLLPGSRVGRLMGQRAVLASAGALERIHSIVGRQSFDLEITGV